MTNSDAATGQRLKTANALIATDIWGLFALHASSLSDSNAIRDDGLDAGHQPSSPSDDAPEPPGEGVGCGRRPPIAVPGRKVDPRERLFEIIAHLIARRLAYHLNIRRLAIRIYAVPEFYHAGGIIARRCGRSLREVVIVIRRHVDHLRRDKVGAAFDFIEILMGINAETRLSLHDDKHHGAREPRPGSFVVVDRRDKPRLSS